MLFEIINTTIVNKGSHLMQCAIAARLREMVPGVRLCRRPHPRLMPYLTCAREGLHLKLPSQVGLFPLGWSHRLIPGKLRQAYGLVGDYEVDAVLDASGFAYSDQWGVAALDTMLARARRWRRSGTRVFLLPQALGPFESPSSKDRFRRLVDTCDRVYPRDPVSFQHAIATGADGSRMRLVPDLTIGFHPEAPRSGKEGAPVYVIPNARMVDKNAVKRADDYVEALAAIVRRVVHHGHQCQMLIHETADDRPLAENVVARTGLPLQIVAEEDPVKLKTLIGSAGLVVGSRFHGLVSALSQEVPVIAMGWSHKYEQLLGSFGQERFIVSADGFDASACDGLIDKLLSGTGRLKATETIREALRGQRESIHRMWGEIVELTRTRA